MNPIYREMLKGCRDAVGPPPRTFSFWDKLFYLKVTKPVWCNARDDLSKYFAARDRLLAEGVVVWGQLVQANSLLFKTGKLDCPGEVIFCTDDRLNVDPTDLAPVAQKTFALKGTTPVDRERARLAAHLTNERTRVFGLTLPSTVSANFPAALTTTFFQRSHLPGRKLKGSEFPLLVMPAPPRFAMILPSRYWPQGLVRDWS